MGERERGREVHVGRKREGEAVLYPVPLASSCGGLSDIANGKVVVMGTTPGSVATYSCNARFILVGMAERKCQNNGQWSGKEPFCQRISCETLIAPNNGIIELRPPAPQSPGDKAIYQCNQGFTLVGGNRKRVCQSDGSYSGEAPTCQGNGYTICAIVMVYW